MKKRSRKVRAVVEESIHFRLCHLCLHLNESPNEVNRCEQCAHEFHSVNDYLMSDADEADSDQAGLSEGGRIRGRGAYRLNGLVAVL